MVAINRAQMQVHSFDQLLDGFVTGSVVSNYLLTEEFQSYAAQLVHNRKKYSLAQWLSTKLCVSFWILHGAYLVCYFYLDHKLPEKQI